MLKVLSDNLYDVAKALDKIISNDRQSPHKLKAKVAQDYYDYQHDILKHRIFYVDANGQLKEDKYASNVRIPHPFFTEQVDQKVHYLLSNPVEFETENDDLKEKLKEYVTDDLQVVLQDMLHGASIKAHEYLYARTTSEDKLTFDVADSMSVVPIHDEDNELKAIVRYYDREIIKGDEIKVITHAERWDEENVTFFVTDKNGRLKPDENKVPNPRPHVVAIGDDGAILGRTYGTIPFYRLNNNKSGTTDLEPIKAIIDDYDLMNAFLSNNLHDFQDAIYVVKGFKGDDLDELRINLKAKKTVGVDGEGGLDIKTVNIPVEARKLKLELDRENIYKFGMAFDSAQVGDGNITNVVIKSRYALLDLKCNKSEARLKAMIGWMIKMIVADINRRYGTAYNADEIEVMITRETMVNENDIVQNELVEAQAKQARIQAILAIAPKVDDETVLKLICEEYDLKYEEIMKRVEEQDYTRGLGEGTDPIDPTDENGVQGVVIPNVTN